MVSKLISRLTSPADLLPSILVGAAGVLLLVQLPSGYSQSAREEVTPPVNAAGANASNLGTGGNSGPIADNGGQVANVKTYGAVGDGATDDTAAFKAALKSLAAAGGGTCLVPKGTYIISPSGFTVAPIPGASSNVHLMGEGRQESILRVGGMPTNHLLQCEGDGWRVQDLTFDMCDYTPKAGLAAMTGSVMRSGGAGGLSPEQMDDELEFMASAVESGIGSDMGTVSLTSLTKNFSRTLRIRQRIALRVHGFPRLLRNIGVPAGTFAIS